MADPTYTVLGIDGDQYNTPYEFRLSGGTFILRLRYNSRDGAGWLFDLSDSDGNELVSSVKIIPQQDILNSFSLNNSYSGYIYCVDTEDDKYTRVITRDNFGTGRRFQLYYFTEDQLRDIREFVEE